MKNIKIAIIGVGNCASSLIQGISYYRHGHSDRTGVISYDVGGYLPYNIDVVAAFDIDTRKVGKDVVEAIFSLPNCTMKFHSDVAPTGTIVQMGRILDGFAPHMKNYPQSERFCPAELPEPTEDQVVAALLKSGAEILVNYLPVGSQKATEFYATCALRAGLGMVNCIPVFIASNEIWAKKFVEAKLPIIGDDVKSQFGATILHRTIMDLCDKRGVKVLRTYQLNTGGNTDFLNMYDRDRLTSKKISKTEAVQSSLKDPLLRGDIHVGPSDYIPWQKDNKVCFIRIEAEIFGGVAINLEARLSVEDSPNSAGAVIDMIRFCKIALDSGASGAIPFPSSFYCKHPPIQHSDNRSFEELQKELSK